MLGLYIHVPFCAAICNYCNFNRGLFDAGVKTRYVAAVLEEIRRAGDGSQADTIFLGGGTPSLLPADDIAVLLEHVGRRFGIAADAEVTLEANPGPDERGDARALRAAGVTRLSIGAQAMSAAGLRRLGLDTGALPLDPLEFVPAPGQGALGIETRADDPATLARVTPLDDPAVRVSVVAERAAMAELEGGCRVPLGAVCLDMAGRLTLYVKMLEPDGSGARSANVVVDLGDPGASGTAAARALR